jgi:hypothetical protein
VFGPYLLFSALYFPFSVCFLVCYFFHSFGLLTFLGWKGVSFISCFSPSSCAFVPLSFRHYFNFYLFIFSFSYSFLASFFSFVQFFVEIYFFRSPRILQPACTWMGGRFLSSPQTDGLRWRRPRTDVHVHLFVRWLARLMLPNCETPGDQDMRTPTAVLGTSSSSVSQQDPVTGRRTVLDIGLFSL